MAEQALPLAQADTPDNTAQQPAPAAAPAQPDQTQAVPTQPQQVQPAQPAPAPAQPQQAQAQPQAQGTPGQPTQGVVAQSEDTPTVVKPTIDPRPYAWLSKNWPQGRAEVDKIADETGVSPQRLAAHWYVESSFGTDNVPQGKAGEVGPLQILPETAARYNSRGQLDPHNWQDNLLLGARYMHDMDNKYGKDSLSSIGAYQSGPGTIDALAAGHTNIADHPNLVNYLGRMAPGTALSGKNFNGRGDMNAQGIVQSAVQGGPDGFLRYIVQTAPKGMGMTDAMRQAEATLVGYAAARGDYAGMQHARDFILQLSHTGANQYLMAAHQALSNGDSQGAAAYLAKAHAFFPDGTMGRFGVDQKGNLWASRIDEHDPSRTLGPPMQVTAQGIQQMLNQTTDPNRYLQTVQEEQKNAADIRHADTMGEYYATVLKSREGIAHERNETNLAIAGGHDNTRLTTTGMNNASRETAAQTRADATVRAAEIRASRQGTGPASKLSAQADKESDQYFSDLAMPNVDDATRGKMSEIYHDVRMGGTTPPQSLAITKGIQSGRLIVGKGADGRYGVVDPKDKSGKPLVYLSPDLGARLDGTSGPQQQQGVPTTPVGAGASTPMARATGVSNNLSGTVMPNQSSAIPTQQAQQ